MKQNITLEFGNFISLLRGLERWYVSCGGAAGSTFHLSFGEKARRRISLKNPAHSEEFRQFEGEVSLLVWCAWRLDGPDSPLTSWDDRKESIEAELSKLIGARIDSVDLVPPAWDLNILFSNSIWLRVFCDHVPGEPSFDGNWDLRAQGKVIAVGPGTRFRIEDR